MKARTMLPSALILLLSGSPPVMPDAAQQHRLCRSCSRELPVPQAGWLGVMHAAPPWLTAYPEFPVTVLAEGDLWEWQCPRARGC